MKITLQETHIFHTIFITLLSLLIIINMRYIEIVDFYYFNNTKSNQQHYTNRFKKIKGIITIIFLKIKKNSRTPKYKIIIMSIFFEDLNDYYYEMRKKYIL